MDVKRVLACAPSWASSTSKPSCSNSFLVIMRCSPSPSNQTPPGKKLKQGSLNRRSLHQPFITWPLSSSAIKIRAPRPFPAKPRHGHLVGGGADACSELVAGSESMAERGRGSDAVCRWCRRRGEVRTGLSDAVPAKASERALCRLTSHTCPSPVRNGRGCSMRISY
jgi:hypothetical protein